MLIVLVTMTVLLLMWSAAYREVDAAVSVQTARADRSLRVDGPLLASARALEYLENGHVPPGASRFRTSVVTADGTYTYVAAFLASPLESAASGGATSWHITVKPSIGIADADLPIL